MIIIRFLQNLICVERCLETKKVREQTPAHGLFFYHIVILRLETLQVFCLEVLDIC